MRPRVTWVLPFLNEQECLPGALERVSLILDRAMPGEMEVILLDSGSSDQSGEIAQKWIESQQGRRGSPVAMRWVNTRLTERAEGPSLGRALGVLREGSEGPQGEWVVILPVDCALGDSAVDVFLRRVRRGSGDEVGVVDAPVGMFFLKAYDPTTSVLRVYSALQNWIRLRVTKLAVWTNAITVSREAWERVAVPRVGFLEDVIWVDRLLAEFGRQRFEVIQAELEVSSRRYYPNRVWRRILVNGWIMVLFRLRLKSVSELRAIYRSLA
jgi:glycosyltransferase involved in cell wall biosynthesis